MTPRDPAPDRARAPHRDPHRQPAAPRRGAPTTGRPTAEPLDAEAFTATVAAVTNAFGDPTRREIYLFVRGSDGVSASEVADRFELHPNVARHHLEKLTGGGHLTVELARAEGAGRPSKRYRATETEGPLPLPPPGDDILAGLLARALELLGPEEAARVADEVGYDYGRSLAARMGPAAGHRSVRSALATVADALTAHGFAAHAEARAGRLAIVSECCPFGDTASRYPHVVCAVDRGMIRGLLAGLYGETNPEFEATRPGGDAHCVARV